jgi:signal recognition particle subunit SRP19
LQLYLLSDTSGYTSVPNYPNFHQLISSCQLNMSHPRVEEVEDSDPEIDDPTDFLPDNDLQIIRPAVQPSQAATSSQAPSKPSQGPNPTLFRPPPPSQGTLQQQSRDSFKTFQTIYPVYFDSSRTRAQGRRVSSKLASPNPLAYNLLAAAQYAFGDSNLPMAFEPDKTHPKDWANPGRVRIQLYHKETRKPLHPHIKNKAHLYTYMAKFLKENPTEREDPLELKIQGLPVPENFTKTEFAKPRGWKMGSILPVHSAAVSGGGVKDDFFKEAMEELRQAQSSGQLPAGMPGGGGGMPDMSALQSMMGGLGGMGGMGGLGGGDSGGGGGKKKKEKKKG